MRRMVMFIVVGSFLFLSATIFAETDKGFDIYKFKRERVDQEIKGNQGYIMGNPPQVSKTRNPERTLIGVDIFVPPLLPEKEGAEDYEEDKIEAQQQRAIEEEEEKQEEVKTETAEEEWIK